VSHDLYENPLLTRYASPEMAALWSSQKKHSTWRKLWIALAESQRELGLDISEVQIEQMKSSVDDIDFDVAAKHEKALRHDVMAHVHTFGDQCPDARAIIHLGATSCFVTDNSELIMMRESLELAKQRLVIVIDRLAKFAQQYRDLPCLGFTHLQPAQPMTVGKRATLWCYDLILDLEELEYRLATLRFRSVKGTTGTQATFLQLFEGDHQKVRELEKLVAAKMGFDDVCAVTGQTYSRKVDAQILDTLSGIGQTTHKAGNDLRILQHRNEMGEPFGKQQVGSSAMAYKKNPMRAERMCSLARFAMSLGANGEHTMATQWMERTLDDSANRRLSLPQSFLAIDAILLIYRNIMEGIEVYPKVIEKQLNEVLPFMATEEFLMAGVRAGGDRQELHEVIRVHSLAAIEQVKVHGVENDLIERLKGDDRFAEVNLKDALDARKYIGRAPQQVDEFLAEVVEPIRKKYADSLKNSEGEVDLKV
jgi:adenylosuccinate lyase